MCRPVAAAATAALLLPGFAGGVPSAGLVSAVYAAEEALAQRTDLAKPNPNVEVLAGEGHGFCAGDAPQHTGYLEAGPGSSYFYYLAESRSQTPEQDPLLLWMTGGPGCSSVLALLLENGPCSVEGRENSSEDEWRMRRNPWSWTEAANVVWVDQPIGVGFSSRGPAGELAYDGRTVGERMVAFLRQFYVKYPQYLNVPFFIVGESYGGHYVPAVAAEVLRHQHSGGLGQLQGIAIGNAMVDPKVQWGAMPMMAFTGGVGGSLGGGVVNEATFLEMVAGMPGCQDGLRLCQEDRQEASCMRGMLLCAQSQILPVKATGRNPYDLRRRCETGNGSSAFTGICYDLTTETSFLNARSTKLALGVPEERPWAACNMTSMLPFVLSGDELADYHESVIELLSAGVKVLVYAGDTDFMVGWLGCRAWVQQLPWAHREAWAQAPNKPFVVDDRRRGRWQSAHGLTFLQIFDAGHMVPMDQPDVALAMVRSLISAPTATDLLASPAAREFSALAILGLAMLAMLALFAHSAALLRKRSRSARQVETEGYVRLV